MEWRAVAVAVPRRSWVQTWEWLERRGVTRDVLRDGILIWASQRVFMLALFAFWQTVMHTFSWAGLFQPFVKYDALWYAEIARNGYDSVPAAAFFPLYPLLMHVVAPVVGGHMLAAGLLLANTAALAAFILLRLLVARDVSAIVARRTLVLLAIFPMSMFFMAAYTESLFLLVSVAAFLAIRARRWVLAGVLITLATLTRGAGVLLVLSLTLEALAWYGPSVSALISRLRTADRSRFVLAGALVLPLATLPVWRAYLDWHYGRSNVFGAALAWTGWQRTLSWPWYGIAQALQADIGSAELWIHVRATRDLFFTFVWLGCCVAMVVALALRRSSLPRSYAAYALSSLALALVFPVYTHPFEALNSVGRYMLVVFPCFVFAAQASVSSRMFWRVLLIAVLLVLVLMAGIFAMKDGFIG